MFYITVATIILMFMFNTYLSYLNYQSRHTPIPDNVVDVYDGEAYLKWMDYTMEVHRYTSIRSIMNTALLILLILIGFFPAIGAVTQGMSGNMIIASLYFLGIYGTIFYVSNLGFGIYRTFSIEKRYGFSTTSIRTFILDQVRTVLMSTLLGGGLVYIILYLYDFFGFSSILYTWVIIMFFTLVMNLLYTRLFIRLFNKLTPLEAGDLYNQCIVLAEKEGYEINKINVMDASKRSTRLNAFFTGFGRFKDIVLYDTLLSKCTEEEVVSVLAHEIGHGKHKDVLKNILISAIQMAAYLGILSFFLSSESLGLAFGFDGAHYGFAMILFGILLEPIGMVISIPLNLMSRKAEYRADASAAEAGYGQAMVRALKVLARENYANLTPHPLVVALTYSHPTISQRIQALERLSRE